MNIPVLTYSGKVVVRPDTTWKRGDEAFYAPDFVEQVTWAPAMYLNICRPGRSIGERFASRYYDAFGVGMLLYPENLVGSCPEGFAMASCIDHTSFLSHPAFGLDSLDEGFSLLKDGEALFSTERIPQPLLDRAVSEVSRFCYLRNGDFLAVELGPRMPLCSRGDGALTVEAFHTSDKVLDFKVVI